MKKLVLIASLAIATLLLSSCGKQTTYKSFVGTWGVERIEYYNTDYAGNPIAASMKTYTYDPDDIDHGIQLVFRENKSGEMLDNAIDTVWTDWNEETQEYDSYIVNPDTVLVTRFTYSYDEDNSILYMSMQLESYTQTHLIQVKEISGNSFVYENEYLNDYMEKAYLKRVSDSVIKSGKSQSKKKAAKPHMHGSLLGEN